jgi:hypothetical protein
MNFPRWTFMVDASQLSAASVHFPGPSVWTVIRAEPDYAEARAYLFRKEAMAQASGKELWP